MMTAAQENLEAWGGQLWWNDPPPKKKQMKKIVCMKMHFRHFPVFWVYVFISGRLGEPNPPPS